MTIRVCCVDEEGRFGGPERRITQIARAVAAHGVDTHVVYPIRDSQRFSSELSAAGVAGAPLSITRLTAEKKVLAQYVTCFPLEVMRLYRFLRKGRFDLVQVNGSQQFKGAIAASLAGIPVIWMLEDALMADAVKRLCTVAAHRIATGLIVAGKRVYDYYVRGTPLESKPIAEIHPHVDTSMFDPDRAVVGPRLGGVPGKRIVTVTGINPTKGLEYFIHMAADLARRDDEVSFFVAGPRYTSQLRYHETLVKLIAGFDGLGERFRFVGPVDDVPSFLTSADVFVFTSISESGPMAVWEAMSMAKPVVTTDVGSVREYIDDGRSGFIVPIKDWRALSSRVEVLVNDPALRQRMGLAARATATARLDVTMAASKYAAFYQTLLREHQQRGPAHAAAIRDGQP